MKRFLYLGVSGHRKWLVAVGLLALVVAAGVGHDRRRRVDASPKSKPVPARVMVDAVRPRRATLHRNDAPLVKDGGPARVLVQALGDRDFPGRVTRSSWLLDDRTRTLRTEIDLPNPDGIFRPGMYATARIPVSRPESLTLPTSSVFLQDDQAWVVRLVANKAVRTPVRLGLRDRQRVEVLRKQTHAVDQGAPAEWEDFTDTDLVVRDNPSTLVDGQEIAIRPERPSVVSLTPDP
jgi:multidrug efflux pump subunit AcrA (membrane-fusion protein)